MKVCHKPIHSKLYSSLADNETGPLTLANELEGKPADNEGGGGGEREPSPHDFKQDSGFDNFPTKSNDPFTEEGLLHDSDESCSPPMEASEDQEEEKDGRKETVEVEGKEVSGQLGGDVREDHLGEETEILGEMIGSSVEDNYDVEVHKNGKTAPSSQEEMELEELKRLELESNAMEWEWDTIEMKGVATGELAEEEEKEEGEEEEGKEEVRSLSCFLLVAHYCQHL